MIIQRFALLLCCLVFGASVSAQTGSVQRNSDPSTTPQLTVTLSDGPYIVGQPILLELKILVPTWMPKAPVYPSFEQPGLLLRMPKRATHPVSETIKGQTWSGTIRRYQIYPLEPTRFRIPAQRVLLTFADAYAQPMQETLLVDEISFQAVLPEAAKRLNSPVIVATGFTLEQTWSGDTELDVGAVLTRRVIGRINGTTAILIPALIPESAPALVGDVSGRPIAPLVLQAYPKDPVVSAQEDSGPLSGRRQEEVTYLVKSAGPITLPPITIEWFNLTSNSVETLRVEGFQGQVPEPPSVPPSPTVVLAVVTLGLVSLLCSWAVSHKFRPKIQHFLLAQQSRWRNSEYYARRAVRKAISAHDLAGVVTHFKTWQGHFPKTSTTKFDEFDVSLTRLGRREYGPSDLVEKSNPMKAPEHYCEWRKIAEHFTALCKQATSQGFRIADARPLPNLNP